MLVAGGYGVAPFALFSRALREHSTPACVFYGGRSASDLPFVDELRKRGLTPTLSTDDGSSGVHGRVTLPLTESLDALLARGEKVRLYACGPHPMMHAVAEIARARTVPCEVSLDPWMGCGLGTCLGCVVRIQRAGETKPKMRPACVDGPVFDAAEVRW
jgi:dihydroorotate dehydrogenase electron transfer subunit